MRNILALGNAASSIVDSLSRYDIYDIYKIKNEGENSKYTYIVPELEHPEEYEKMRVTSKIGFLSKLKKEVTFFVCGASKTAGLSLKILEALHKRGLEIRVVYFQPEADFLSEPQRLQERLTRNVLQEYSRSGLLKEISLVSNKVVESLMGETNVFDYYDKMNGVFCDTFHMIETFKNTKPIMSTFSKLAESSRIKAVGVSTTTCEDKLFFPFKQEVEMLYYFGINEKKLKSQGGLFRELTNSVKAKISKDTKAYFGIYPTNYEDDYIYVEYYSPKIQDLDLDT